MSELSDMLQEQAIQGEKIKTIETTCLDIKKCLTGNGKPGLVVRTDRLEQKDKFKTKMFWVCFVAVITMLVKNGFEFFSDVARAMGH
jgi:hypothetical protein